MIGGKTLADRHRARYRAVPELEVLLVGRDDLGGGQAVLAVQYPANPVAALERDHVAGSGRRYSQTSTIRSNRPTIASRPS